MGSLPPLEGLPQEIRNMITQLSQSNNMSPDNAYKACKEQVSNAGTSHTPANNGTNTSVSNNANNRCNGGTCQPGTNVAALSGAINLIPAFSVTVMAAGAASAYLYQN
jgi:hypothetical protein